MTPPDAEALYRILYRELLAAYGDALGANDENGESVALVGIYSGGAWLAERIAAELGAARGTQVAHGVVNISLHRDDFAEKGLQAQSGPTSLPFDIGGRRIVLLDDVLYTGRTIRAALNELYDYGRPAAVDLAVLVDRGARELPIAARFVGQTLEVSPDLTLVLRRGDDAALSFVTEPRA